VIEIKRMIELMFLSESVYSSEIN